MNPTEDLFNSLKLGDFEAADAALAAGADVNATPWGARAPMLHFFLTEGRTAQTRWLHAHGADIDAVDVLGDTALLLSIQSAHQQAFSLALELGADVDKANTRGVTPVIRAALFPHGEPYLQRLIEAGANLNATSTMGLSALLAAVGDGQLAMAKNLLDHGADPRGVDENGRNIITAAVRSGKPRVLALVLERTEAERASGEIDIEYAAGGASRAIAQAVHSPDMVVLLMRAGANINAQSKNKMDPGVFPWMVLVSADADGTGSLTREALAAGADLRQRDRSGNNALPYVVAKGLDGKGAVLKALIEAGFDPAAPTGPQALSPLHLALDYNPPLDDEGAPEGPTRQEVIEILVGMGFPALPRAWSDPKAPSPVKPLPPPPILALMRKDVNSAQAMIGPGATVNDLDDRGQSLLHHLGGITGMSREELFAVSMARQHMQAAMAPEASSEVSPDATPRISKRAEQAKKVREEIEEIEAAGREIVAQVAQWFSERGADWSLRDPDGLNPLMAMARANGHLMMGQVVRFHGGRLDDTDRAGWTAADHAFSAGALDALHAMLAHQAAQPEGLSPFHRLVVNAVQASPETVANDPESHQRRSQFIGLLRSLPANPLLIDGQDADGNSALIVAAATGQDDAVRTLLALGASPDLANAVGETALLHAVDRGESDIVRLLRAAGANPQRAATNGTRPLDLASAGTPAMRAALTDSAPADAPEPIQMPQALADRIASAARSWGALSPPLPSPPQLPSDFPSTQRPLRRPGAR